MTRDRFALSRDFYNPFLCQLIDLLGDYRRDERYKLAGALEQDIFSLAGMMQRDMEISWDDISTPLTPWRRRTFRHLDIASKEKDDARDVLTHNLGTAFTKEEIEALLDYCIAIDLPILITALGGMVANEHEYAERNRRVTLYTNLKNILTGFEYLSKSIMISKNTNSVAPGNSFLPTLTPIIRDLMDNRTVVSFI